MNRGDLGGVEPATRVSVAPSLHIYLASYASFILIGWTGLFVPSLLRVLEDDFARSDAEFGLLYLVIALLFAAGALSSGLIAGRVGRRVVLPVASRPPSPPLAIVLDGLTMMPAAHSRMRFRRPLDRTRQDQPPADLAHIPWTHTGRPFRRLRAIWHAARAGTS